MANNSKDVELRIRARDYSQKTLKQVVSGIEELSKAQDEQRKSAERGEASMKDLEASYKKLESAGQALLKLNSLVEVYKRQTAALTEQLTKLEAARAKQAELAETYRTTEKVSKTLETQMGRANRAVETQSKKFADAEARVSRTAGELQRYGVATTDIARTQSSIVTSVARVNSVLEQQDKIIQEAPAAAKRYKDAKDEQAKADAQAASAAAMAMSRIEEQAYAQNKIIDSLRRQADQALAAAKGYQTLGRVVASTRLSGNTSLAGDLQTIISPAAAARSTLAGLEKQVDGLSTSLEASAKDSKAAAGALKELQAAQNAAVGMARLIDQFQAQTAAVRAARAEYNAARREVQEMAAQMRAATGDTANLGTQMQNAQQRLNAASNALRQTGASARQSQAALKAAGVDTRTLGTESDRLRSTVDRTRGGVDQLSEALKRNEDASKKAGKGFSFFEDQGRKTLSTVQRIRGELLSLVTTYVGLQAGVDLAGGAIDAYKMRQQAMIKISQVVGQDQAKINSEWDYMVGLADKLGIKLEDVASGYTSFAVAAKASGITLDQTKYIFESIAKTGRVFHLSADDLQGVFRAMQQMLSKGQVYAEELTGQLGERLPAAVALFAKGMNMTTGELLKAMQNGEISSQAVINFARENAKAIDAQVATASKGVDAMEARAQNAMTSFKLALADSGFIDAYTRLLQRLTEYLASSDGKDAAKNLGEAFAKLADVLIWCIDNVDLLVTALGIFAGLKVVGLVVGLIGQLRTLGTVIVQLGKIGDGIIKTLAGFSEKMIAAGGAARIMGTGLGVLTRAIPFVGWALLAYDIGAIMYSQSQTFAKAVDLIVADFKQMANIIIAIAKSPTAAIQDLVYAVLRPITTMFSDTLKKIAQWIASVLQLIPGVGDDLSKFALDLADNLTKENRDMFQNVSKVWDDVNKKWVDMNNDIKNKYDDTMSEVVKKTLQTKAQMLQADLAGATAFQFTADPGGGITERQRKIDALTKSLEKQQKAAEKADMAGKKALQRKNLPGRLALVDEEFAPQMKQAQAIGGKEGEKLVAQLNGIIALRKKAETAEFQASQRSTSGVNKRQKAIESLTNKYKELQASIQMKTVAQDPTSTLQERTQAAILKMQQQYNELKDKASKIGGKEGAQLTNQLNTLEQANQKYIEQKMQLEEIARLEAKLQSLQEARKNQIDTINANRKAGVISEDTQVAQTVAVNQNMNPQIASATNALSAQADQSKSLFSDEEWTGLQANIANAKASMQDLTGTYTKMDSQIVQGVLDGVDTGISSIVDNMSKVVAGTQSMGDAFAAVGVAMLQFFSQLLQQIATAIIKQLVLNMLMSAMGGGATSGVGAAAAAAGGAAMHNGGIVGDKSSGTGVQARQVQPGWFANAKRYHDGGLPGLKSDEVPAILQKGEQVLDKNDPNNILNMSKGGNSSRDPSSTRFVLVDDRAKIPEAMNAPEGEQVILQILKRNAPSVRQIVKNSGKSGRGG